VKIIAIEEHWNSVSIRDALDLLPRGARDESVAFNSRGDNRARLEDIGPGRERRGHRRRPHASGPLPRVRDPADQRSAGRSGGAGTVRPA
jgi:hypothetical protein